MMDFSEMFYFAPDPCVMECLCKNMYGYNEYVIMSGRVYTRNLSFVEDMFVKYDPQVKGDYEAAPFPCTNRTILFSMTRKVSGLYTMITGK